MTDSQLDLLLRELDAREVPIWVLRGMDADFDYWTAESDRIEVILGMVRAYPLKVK